jgi:hypothetical protein
MRAVLYTHQGDASVLELGERPVPEPGEREIRVRVVVSGVNPTDWKSRSGAFGGGLRNETVPNHGGAGMVDEVGRTWSRGLRGRRSRLADPRRRRSLGERSMGLNARCQFVLLHKSAGIGSQPRPRTSTTPSRKMPSAWARMRFAEYQPGGGGVFSCFTRARE